MVFAKTWRNSKSHYAGSTCAFIKEKNPKTKPFVCSFTILSIHSQFLSAASFKSGWASPQGAEYPQPALMKSQGDNTQLGAGGGYCKAHISQWHLHTHQTGSLKNLPKLRKRENRYKNQLQKTVLNKNLVKKTFSNKSRLNFGVVLFWMVAFLMKQVYFLNYFLTDKQLRLDIPAEGVICAINISSYSY